VTQAPILEPGLVASGTIPGVTPACRAAADIAANHGIRADNPLLLQETNNTVVWLRPSDVIAKVGTRADSADELQREYEVARLRERCRGPIEWDLAFLPEEARANFSTVDEDLLAVLSSLNSARVATWCWVQARFPLMRRHAEHHLGLLRRDWPA
jgi:hypothetical protein